MKKYTICSVLQYEGGKIKVVLKNGGLTKSVLLPNAYESGIIAGAAFVVHEDKSGKDLAYGFGNNLAVCYDISNSLNIIKLLGRLDGMLCGSLDRKRFNRAVRDVLVSHSVSPTFSKIFNLKTLARYTK